MEEEAERGISVGNQASATSDGRLAGQDRVRPWRPTWRAIRITQARESRGRARSHPHGFSVDPPDSPPAELPTGYSRFRAAREVRSNRSDCSPTTRSIVPAADRTRSAARSWSWNVTSPDEESARSSTRRWRQAPPNGCSASFLPWIISPSAPPPRRHSRSRFPTFQRRARVHVAASIIGRTLTTWRSACLPAHC